jgi:hypothetical protein
LGGAALRWRVGCVELEHLSQSTRHVSGQENQLHDLFAALIENKSLKALDVSHNIFSSSFKTLSTLAIAMTADGQFNRRQLPYPNEASNSPE